MATTESHRPLVTDIISVLSFSCEAERVTNRHTGV
jgi:hypothetical protein